MVTMTTMIDKINNINKSKEVYIKVEIIMVPIIAYCSRLVYLKQNLLVSVSKFKAESLFNFTFTLSHKD